MNNSIVKVGELVISNYHASFLVLIMFFKCHVYLMPCITVFIISSRTFDTCRIYYSFLPCREALHSILDLHPSGTNQESILHNKDLPISCFLLLLLQDCMVGRESRLYSQANPRRRESGLALHESRQRNRACKASQPGNPQALQNRPNRPDNTTTPPTSDGVCLLVCLGPVLSSSSSSLLLPPAPSTPGSLPSSSSPLSSSPYLIILIPPSLTSWSFALHCTSRKVFSQPFDPMCMYILQSRPTRLD